MTTYEGALRRIYNATDNNKRVEAIGLMATIKYCNGFSRPTFKSTVKANIFFNHNNTANNEKKPNLVLINELIFCLNKE
jgi:hypothetical protein